MRSIVVGALVALLPTSAVGEIGLTGNATQVTLHSAPQSNPAIDGDFVVFSDLRAGDLDVRYVDVNAIGTDVLVGSGPGSQRLHDVSGNRIVYTDDAAPGGAVVMVYDVSSAVSTPIIVSTPGAEFDPSIDGDTVAYEARGATSSDIAVAKR